MEKTTRRDLSGEKTLSKQTKMRTHISFGELIKGPNTYEREVHDFSYKG